MMRALPLRFSGGNSSSGLYARRRLAQLNFETFQRCVWLWLGASGYRDIKSCGRRAQRGRKAAGPDFVVRLGRDGMEIAVQIRHWQSPVSKRAVDELRGTLLRDNIPAGMIVASSESSIAARVAAATYPGRPIRIIGIDRLCESLEELGIQLDERFFRTLGKISLGSVKSSVHPRQAGLKQAGDRSIDFQLPEPWSFPWLIALVVACYLLLLWSLQR